MSENPSSSLWKQLRRSVMPLSRVASALADVESSPDDAAKLLALREQLEFVRMEGGVEARALHQAVLVALIQGALRSGDVSSASDLMRELDESAKPEPERFRILEPVLGSLQEAGRFDLGADHVLRWLADERTSAKPAHALLCWLFTFADVEAQAGARECVSDNLRRVGNIAALLELSQFDGSPAAAVPESHKTSGIDPQDYADWPFLKIRAHLLRARQSERKGKWLEMMAEARSARSLERGLGGSFQSLGGDLGQWIAFWLIRALIYDGLVGEAAHELSALTRENDDPLWNRLAAIVKLGCEPDREDPQAVLAILEDESAEADHSLALLSLCRHLRPLVEGEKDALRAFADCAIRIEAAKESLPWTRYALGVKALVVDEDYAECAGFLAEAERPFPDSCSIGLMRAICAIVRGDMNVLESSLAEVSAIRGALKPDAYRVEMIAKFFKLSRSPRRDWSAGLNAMSLRAPGGPLSTRLPEFAAVHRLLEILVDSFVRGHVEGGTEIDDYSFQEKLISNPWAYWILLRLCLRMHPRSRSRLFAFCDDRQDRLHPACAWDLMVWFFERPDTASAKSSAKAKGLIENLADCDWVTNEKVRARLVESWRQLGAGKSGSKELVARLKNTSGGGASPGRGGAGFLDEFWTFDAEVESRYLAGRFELRSGRIHAALEQFQECRRLLEGGGLCGFLSEVKLQPVIDYWEGAALARLSEFERAGRLLTRSRQGPKAEDAEVQRVLTFISRGQTVAARRLLDGLADETPASHYACGLLDEQDGHTDSAQDHLDRCQRLGAESGSPYVAAARSFLAGMRERSADEEGAIEMYRANLRDGPDDEVASARLGRLLLIRALRNGSELTEAERREIVDLFKSVQGYQPGWVQQFAFLASCLDGSVQPPVELPAEIVAVVDSVEEQAAWRQLICRVHLERGTLDAAARLMGSAGEGDFPSWFQEARLILRSWKLITQPGGGAEQLERCAEEIDALPCTETSSEPKRWGLLARRFAGILNAGDADVLWGIWSELDPSPFASVPGLWSADRDERRQAAEAILGHGMDGGEPGWSNDDRHLLRLIAHQVLGNNDGFAEEYRFVEPRLRAGSLPVCGSDVWKTAARWWFRKEDWASLLDQDRPPCVADLSDPDVRLLIGLGHTRRAAQLSADGKYEDAVRESKRAQTVLIELIG